MRCKLKRNLPIIMGGTVGAFIGQAFFLWYDLRHNPWVYEMRSAPWYTGLLVSGAVCGGAFIIELAVLLVVRHRLRKDA